MREIKFKAFNKKTKETCMVLSICFVNKYVDVLPERNLEGGNQESWNFDDIELMQYTGLKNKNNIEIYEGNTIKYLGFEVKNGKQLRLEKFFILKDFILDCYRAYYLISNNNDLEIINNYKKLDINNIN